MLLVVGADGLPGTQEDMEITANVENLEWKNVGSTKSGVHGGEDYFYH